MLLDIQRQILNFSKLVPKQKPVSALQSKKIYEKMKNYPGYIILIHKCIINDNHKIYGF